MTRNAIRNTIVAVSDGVVIDAGPTPGYGIWGDARHADGTGTVYGNITTRWSGRRAGDGRRPNRHIGNRGNSTGQAPAFEVLQGGPKNRPCAVAGKRGYSSAITTVDLVSETRATRLPPSSHPKPAASSSESRTADHFGRHRAGPMPNDSRVSDDSPPATATAGGKPCGPAQQPAPAPTDEPSSRRPRRLRGQIISRVGQVGGGHHLMPGGGGPIAFRSRAVLAWSSLWRERIRVIMLLLQGTPDGAATSSPSARVVAVADLRHGVFIGAHASPGSSRPLRLLPIAHPVVLACTQKPTLACRRTALSRRVKAC